MTDIFLKIDRQLNKKQPFCVYRKPGSKIVIGIFQEDTLSYSNKTFTEDGFVFAPFQDKKNIFIPSAKATIITTKTDEETTQVAEPYMPAVNENDKIKFEKLVAKSVAAIRSGSFDKVVVSRKEEIVYKKIAINQTLKNLLQTYPNAFCYCFYHPETDVWMGATPEQLIKINGSHINTVALAGTQLYSENKNADWGNKEIQEQEFVTQYITENLNPYVKDLTTTKPYTYRAGNIVHIKTDINATLKEPANHIASVINALHPTPAVCGMPKKAAKEFIKKNEDYNREFYTGFLGETGKDFAIDAHDNTDLYVNLRCMKIQGNTVQLYIGCGITKDSDPEKEFLETVNKSITMRKVIA